MRSAARSLVFVLLALSAAAAAAQGRPSDETRILEESTKKDEGTSSAPPPDDDDEQRMMYSALGLSRVSPNFDNVKEAINIDVTAIGFRIPPVPWAAVELNFGLTVIPGQVTTVRPGSPGSPTGCGPLGLSPCPGGNATTSTQDFQMSTIGALVVARSPGKFYGMGKLGYRYMNTSLPELEEDRSGSGWALGLGYRWNTRGSFIEVGYTQHSADLFAIGFEVAFGYNRH